VLVDARHGRSGATGTPLKLGWNIGCELELNYRGDNARLYLFTCDTGRFPRPVLLITQALGDSYAMAARPISGRQCTLCTRHNYLFIAIPNP